MRWKTWLLPFAAGACVLLVIRHFDRDIYLTPIFGILFMVLSVLLAKYPTKVLVNSFTRFAGRGSFSAYLIHPVILATVLRFHPAQPHRATSFIAVFLLTLTSSLAAAWAMWNGIEVQFQNVGRNLIRKLESADRACGEEFSTEHRRIITKLRQ